jgi:hypothetical protein
MIILYGVCGTLPILLSEYIHSSSINEMKTKPPVKQRAAKRFDVEKQMRKPSSGETDPILQASSITCSQST